MQTRPHTAAGGGVAALHHRFDIPSDHPVEMGIEQAARPESPRTVSGELSSWDDAKTSLDRLAHHMRLMVKRIQDLRHLGIEDKGLPLPKICVVGDQSAGKSSLIEGMSEIKVPRSSGTCTRCPLEINLSESDGPWTCRVLLMKRYIYDTTAKNKRATLSKPLGPWIGQDPEQILLTTINDKEQVPEALRWAQLATLNPGKAPAEFEFVEELDSNVMEVKFSPNIIRLDISAPGFPNLSFYDLPGVINQTEFEDEKYLVTLVENLVKEYIKAPNCIVLLAMPMTDDATNSSAARIVRDTPGARERTLGVLTKPDRAPPEDGFRQWNEILEGEKFALGHGYYIVKNNPDTRVDHAQAREEELHFFAQPPWTAELAPYRGRFGTRRLQAALSELLLQQIQASLPRIISQLNRRAEIYNDELATLPEPPIASFQLIVSNKLHEYSVNIKCHCDGGDSGHSFKREWLQLVESFKKSLANSRPNIRLREEFPIWGISPVPPAGDDSDVEWIGWQPSPSKRKGVVNGDSEVKRVKVMQSTPPFPGREPSGREHPATGPFAAFQEPVRTFQLEELREVHRDTYAATVPGLGNPKAVESLNRIVVQHWKAPMEEFIQRTYRAIHEVLLTEQEKIFADLSRTVLCETLRRIVLDFIETTRAENFKYAATIYDAECDPFTTNTDAYARAKESELALLRCKRRASRATRYAKEVELHSGKKIDPAKVTDIQIGPDEFEKEIETMAHVRAYYDIASARFVDNITQSVRIGLFRKCCNGLRDVILRTLGILDSANAAERCRELAVEDQDRENRRKFLKREIEKVTKALTSLQDVTESDLFVQE